MIRNVKHIRLASVLALTTVAAASQAVQVFIDSQVNSGFPAIPFTGFTESVDANTSGAPFTNVLVGSLATLSFTSTGPGSTAAYTSGTDNITFTFNSATTLSVNNSVTSQSLGTVTSATGAFAPFLNQTGVIVTSTSNLSTGSNDFTITGNLNPTPEPASFAALGIGVVALVRRRRKA